MQIDKMAKYFVTNVMEYNTPTISVNLQFNTTRQVQKSYKRIKIYLCPLKIKI